MQIIKIFIVGVASIIVMIALFRNLHRWGAQFHGYMFREAGKVFGNDAGWGRRWTLLMTKAIIVFFALMLILGVYVLVFGSAGS
jgi:hypothetical protein